LSGAFNPVRAFLLGEEVGDMQPEVIRHLLKPPERDPAARVLQLGEGRRRHAQQARLLSQAHSGVCAQPPDTLPDERDKLVIRAG
jgi:hypothetical protein